MNSEQFRDVVAPGFPALSKSHRIHSLAADLSTDIQTPIPIRFTTRGSSETCVFSSRWLGQCSPGFWILRPALGVLGTYGQAYEDPQLFRNAETHGPIDLFRSIDGHGSSNPNTKPMTS